MRRPPSTQEVQPDFIDSHAQLDHTNWCPISDVAELLGFLPDDPSARPLRTDWIGDR